MVKWFLFVNAVNLNQYDEISDDAISDDEMSDDEVSGDKISASQQKKTEYQTKLEI